MLDAWFAETFARKGLGKDAVNQHECKFQMNQIETNYKNIGALEGTADAVVPKVLDLRELEVTNLLYLLLVVEHLQANSRAGKVDIKLELPIEVLPSTLR